MKDSKLIKILKTFSQEDIKSFEKFISSPYFNSVKNYLTFFKELMKFYPEFNDDKLTRENIYKKLFRGKPFNKQMMWNLTSGFEKLTTEFLVQTALSRKKFQGMELLVSEYGNRKLLDNYLSAIKEMESQVESTGIDYAYFENKVHLETYKQIYHSLKNNQQAMGISKVRASEYQILLFLKMIVGGLNDMSLGTKDYNDIFDMNIPLEFAKNIDLKNIIIYAHGKNFEYAFLLEIYYHSLMMLLEALQTEHLKIVRKLYKIHFNKFNLPEKRVIMHWILTYCIHRSETDGIEYERTIFELNKFRLKEELVFFKGGYLHEAIYIQIISNALLTGQIKWTESFIENYTPRLQPELQASKKAMAYSYLHFQTKQYDKVLEDINNFEYFDTWDKVFAKNLLAKTYYEMKQFDALLYHIDSSKHFIKTNKSVSKLYEKSYGNFFNLLTKLISVNENADIGSIPVLKKEIESTVKVENKSWLLEKINELAER